MRITGILHTIGTMTMVSNFSDTTDPEAYELETVQGILITSSDEETHRAAANFLFATVDIYPHPVNGLVAGECTPENYAHALARLAHTEDHLAREVRSSQALAAALETAQAHIAELTQLLAIAEGSATKYEQKYLEASRALGEARAVLDSMNLANARHMADDETIAGDSELSDNEDEGRR